LTFPSNVWSGTNPIYVTGVNVGIGTFAPVALLHSFLSNSTTNAVTYPLRIQSHTTGTIANGYGTGIDMYTDFSGGAYEAASLQVIDTDVGSGDTALTFSTNQGGVGFFERMNIGFGLNTTSIATINSGGGGGGIQDDSGNQIKDDSGNVIKDDSGN